MTELVGSWLHFAPRQPKRKRAETVCVYCHSKKIKCDLESRTNNGHRKCSNCEGPDRECRLRQSRRGKQRQVAPVDDGADLSFIPSPPLASDILLPTDLAEYSLDRVDLGLARPEPEASTSIGGPPGTHVIQFEPHQASPTASRTSGQAQATTSPGIALGRSHSGDVDTGFLQVYGPENQFYAEQQELEAALDPKPNVPDPRQQELQQSFAETYWEYCYAWCPVLDRQTLDQEMADSPLLANAVALAASHIQPPLVPHDGPAKYYNNAQSIFYNDEEPNSLTALKAVTLFYWWAPNPPTTAHRHSSWWWTSTIIRTAQQMNIHREPPEGHPSRDRLDLGLRRRLWWTVFARERLTALCQSKPCIIDPEDCNIQEVQLSDFPSDAASQKKGEIFIFWTRLCAIIGRIAKHLSRTANSPEMAFPTHLRQELIEWVHSLPAHLQLPIGSSRTESFDRDVHQLHLPYLTVVIILHLKRSAHDLPQALPPAILAGSCIARILRDILSRGNVRFLMAITCWYSGTAFLALLQGCKIGRLAKEAEEGLDVLERAVAQLQNMWGSAKVVGRGFERLRKTRDSHAMANNAGGTPRPADMTGPPTRVSGSVTALPLNPGDVRPTTPPADDFDWTQLFPFVTPLTNGIAKCLLSDKARGTIPSPTYMNFQEDLFNQYQDLLDPFTDYSFDFSAADIAAMM